MKNTVESVVNDWIAWRNKVKSRFFASLDHAQIVSTIHAARWQKPARFPLSLLGRGGDVYCYLLRAQHFDYALSIPKDLLEAGSQPFSAQRRSLNVDYRKLDALKLLPLFPPLYIVKHENTDCLLTPYAPKLITASEFDCSIKILIRECFQQLKKLGYVYHDVVQCRKTIDGFPFLVDLHSVIKD